MTDTVTLPLTSTEDKTITCIVCARADCEFEVHVGTNQGSAWHGLHEKCRPRAEVFTRSELESKYDKLQKAAHEVTEHLSMADGLLELERRNHDETRGYRQKAEQELDVAREHVILSLTAFLATVPRCFRSDCDAVALKEDGDEPWCEEHALPHCTDRPGATEIRALNDVMKEFLHGSHRKAG